VLAELRGPIQGGFSHFGDQKKKTKQQNVVIDSFLCFKISNKN
jgi:hypothetical protein